MAAKVLYLATERARRAVAPPVAPATLRAEGGLVRLEVAPGRWLVMTPGHARVWARGLETMAETADAQCADARRAEQDGAR